MISRFGEKGFFAAHYDWIVLAVGLLALAAGGVFYAMPADEDADGDGAISGIVRSGSAATGVKAVDLSAMAGAIRLVRNPPTVPPVSEKDESFLSSERMILCKKCRKAISPDRSAQKTESGDKVVICPYCKEKQAEEKKIVLDADGDGMADEWEKKNGLNPNLAADAGEDADKDGFTNLEEYLAKTDPQDAKDHPEYTDSLKVVLPLKETYLPFVFTKATQIPSGWRCEFFDAKQKDDYGRPGRTITATIGEEIGTSGFVLRKYEKKGAKRVIKGTEGLMKTVDVSEAVVERKGDKKTMTLVISANKKAKPMPVDIQATLSYSRGTVRTLDVVQGSEIDLNGTKYKVIGIRQKAQDAEVTLQKALSPGKNYVIRALEQ